MRSRVGIVLLGLVAAGGVARAQQDLGHKTLGTLGLDAGELLPPGLYALDAVAAYRTDAIFDRNGHQVPIAADGHAIVNIFGFCGNFDLPRLHTSIGATVTVPVAHVSVTSEDPRASLDDFGLGDLYVQPLQLGWRPWHQELLLGYAFYAPTGHRAPGGIDGVGDGQWTHELSGGGTVYFDRARRFYLSALVSYELHAKKLDVDITRGQYVQIQGGVGAKLAHRFDVGVAGYALWQVTDDRGSALPSILAGARDVDYGLGPELDINVSQLRSRLTVRYTRDVFVRSRPRGELVLVALMVSAWSQSR